ncbi:DMT family transporter [Rhodoferax fermentans]|uniref:EamA family transporter n=1 Tax=Rhodoferax fermentans TaxID=28066 RepID=A0A1T1AS10_RHOFE|nr:DMT family transporter [Rhodoferax fermentans]MBK1684407.1 EamA/RhaT family transporter [Rhodoferax fermentans]OOV06886.1 EamA family transporter [Rhodoferax fermentans]
MTTLPLQQPAHLLRLSDLTLLVVAMVWGTSYGVAKGALAFYPVLGFLALRFGLTFVLLLSSLLRASAQQRRDAWRSGLPLGGWLLAIFLCETFGVAHTQASNAALLISLCVVMTPFAQWWLLGQRPAPALFGFAAVSLLGAALLSGGLTGGLAWGDGLMLGAAVLRAILVCQTSRLTRQSSATSLQLTAVQSGVICLGCLLLALLTRGGLPDLPSQMVFWQGTLYLVLGCTVFAFFAQNWALKHSAPSRVALLTSSEPAFGALFAVWWLGESLSPLGWLGAALIVLAALWTTWRRH